MKVWIGTEAAHEAVVPDGQKEVAAATVTRTDGGTEEVLVPEYNPLDGARVASISLPEDLGSDIAGALNEVVKLLPGILQPCSTCNGTGVDDSDAPSCSNCGGSRVESVTWVASDNDLFQGLLAHQLGAARGVPSDVEDTHHTENGPPGESTEAVQVGPEAPETIGTTGFVSQGGFTDEPHHHFDYAHSIVHGLELGCHEHFRRYRDHDGIAFLRTAAGRDFQSRVMGDTASTGTGSYAAANYIATTENSTAPGDSDTTLTGELTDSGLARAQGAYAHVAGASTYTITKTFTSGTATARTPAKAGLFNASSSGTMAFETPITNPPPLQLGDSITITWTITIT